MLPVLILAVGSARAEAPSSPEPPEVPEVLPPEVLPPEVLPPEAAPPEASPARRCATAATGTEIEVCLRLAAEHPSAVDELTAALVAWMDRAEAPDRALLRGAVLLLTGSPDAGAEALAVTGDPRAAALLLAAGRGLADPAARQAALRALAGFPAALPRLADVVRDRALDPATRVAAVEGIGRMGTDDAADRLVDLARLPGLPGAVRQALTRTLARRWPDRLPPDPAPTEDGAAWLSVGGAISLGYAMGAAGWFGRGQLWPAGVLTGSTAGGTVGWLYGRAWPKEAGDTGLVASTAALGTATGLLFGAAVGGEPDAAILGGLVGDATGVALGAAAAPLHRGRGPDAAEGTLLAALAGGSGALAARTRGGDPALGAGVGLAAGTLVGHAASPGFSLGRDLPLVTVGAVVGGFGGAILPVDDPVASAGSGLLGGAAVAGALGAAVDAPADVVGGGVAGGVAGAALGTGAALAGGSPPGTRAALGVGLGAVGLLGGITSAVFDPDPIDDRDVVVAGAAGAWAGWNAAAIGALAGGERSRVTGATLVAAVAAGGLGTAANQAFDVPVPDTLCASSLGIWGGYVGWLSADLAGVEPLAVAIPASDAGLLVGGLLVSPRVGVPALVLGVADAGGAFGGSAGALVASLATPDRRAVTAASLAGAALGGGVGLGVGVAWHRSRGRRDVAGWHPELPPLSVGPGPGDVGLTVGSAW